MFNVVLVDDEVISRIGISNMIDWESEGLNLIRTFDNGKDALAYLLENPIDILITDLKMPIMDGLELLEQLDINQIDCQCIVLTAFDDFQFVKQAFKYGVCDYLRKLDLNKDVFLDVLTLAKDKILPKENTLTTNLSCEISDTSIFNNADFLHNKRSYIKELMYGNRIVDENFLIDCDLRDLQFPHSNIYVLLLYIHNTLPQTNTSNILQMLDDTLSDAGIAYATWTGLDEIGIIFNTSETLQQKMELEVQQWANRIQFVFKEYFNYSLTIYASEIFSSPDKISTAYLQVHQAKHNKNYAPGENLVFYSEVMERRAFADSLVYETTLNTISTGLSQNNSTLIHSALIDLIAHLKKSKYIEIQHFYLFSTTVIGKLDAYFSAVAFTSNQKTEHMNPLHSLPNSLHRKSDFINYLVQLDNIITNIFSTFTGNHLVNQAKNYLTLHYTENINFQTLADSLNVSSNHLSMLYKRETGETLKDYLINLRMEKAKKMLLATTLQISDISREVGYDNEHYFSRIFKQKIGMSPSSFRNK